MSFLRHLHARLRLSPAPVVDEGSGFGRRVCWRKTACAWRLNVLVTSLHSERRNVNSRHETWQDYQDTRQRSVAFLDNSL